MLCAMPKTLAKPKVTLILHVRLQNQTSERVYLKGAIVERKAA